MRTKTLLTAIAALAAGIAINSSAQVYSANVVGYATIATPHSGTYYSLSIPFQIGISNGANEVFGNSLPEFSQLLIWDSGTQGYNIVQTDTSSPSGWSDAATFDPVPVPTLPVGQGFFLNPSQDNVTNTFSGAVIVNVGVSNSIVLPNSGVYYMVGCLVPYAGAITNGTASGGGPNLNSLPEFSQVLLWNADSQSYNIVQPDSSSATGWSDSATFDPVPVPSLSVGQGFFINLSQDNYTWTTGL